MIERKSIGSGLVDYVIPTAVVGLVIGLGLFALKDSGNLLKFFAASGGIDVAADNSATIGEVEDTSGFVDGAGSKKIITTSVCEESVCTLDFGSYTLDGIPEDFSDYIESSSSSGGTDLLADLLTQLAEEADLPEAEKDLIKALANYGHDIASAERGVEDYYTTNEISNGFIPEEANDYVRQLSAYTDDSSINNFTETLSSVMSSLESSSSPDAALTKEMVGVLSSEIIAMAGDFLELTVPLDAGPEFSTSTAQESVNLILNPDASERTDIDAALICSTGSGEDHGLVCN